MGFIRCQEQKIIVNSRKFSTTTTVLNMFPIALGSFFILMDFYLFMQQRFLLQDVVSADIMLI
jgi:hypothetical protein